MHSPIKGWKSIYNNLEATKTEFKFACGQDMPRALECARIVEESIRR
jgi:hypothetical protein